jgi:putative membrane protein
MQHEQSHGMLTAADRAFAREAAIGGMAEVELGKLASDKGSSADVKQFGQRMVDDHSKANDELKEWAQKANFTLPAQLDAKHKATHDRLAKLSGPAFDRAYMRDMVKDHQEDVAAFRKASKSLHDADLKAFASKTLPTLEEHLQQAKKVQGEVVGTTGRGR